MKNFIKFYNVTIFYDKKLVLLVDIFVKFVLMDSKITSALGDPLEVTKKEIGPAQSKTSIDSVFDVYNDPAMKSALDVLPLLGKHKEITLRAKGDSIPNAVAIANIITMTILKGNSKIQKITVSSEPIQELGKTLSSIEITLRKI